MKISFSEVFADETKNGTKLKTCDYQTSGTYPIIDQGQDFIAGYTDSVNGLYTNVPAIIFGDHTRVLKYVDFPFFLGADGAKILKARSAHTNYKYLYYALKSVRIPDTGYNRHFKWLKEAAVSIPNSQKQESIVFTLDSISRLISNRRAQLAKLDELVKCRFVEMFGDENNVASSEIRIGEIADVQVGIVIKPSQYYTNQGGVKAFRSLNVGEGFIKNEDWVYFSESAMRETQRTTAHTGDILVVRSGRPGTACIVTEEYNGCNVIDLLIVRPNHKHILPEYLCAFTNLPHGKNQIESQQRGIAQQHFNVGMYREMKIVVPPIRQQKSFVSFLARIDKLRFIAGRKKSFEHFMNK